MIATTNRLGLDAQGATEVAGKLNQLLANYQLFYMNLRAFHWNIKGEKFFELHEKFEEMYNDALVKIDEIAERILTLGDTPLHTYSDYLELAKVKELRGVTSAKESVNAILDGYAVLLPLERDILEQAGEMQDEGTSALMSDYIREQEKLVWMFTSYLG